MEKTCLFCDKNNSKKHVIIDENNLFYARWDNFPVSKGHAEIVPKKHITSFFDLSEDELKNFYILIKEVKKRIKDRFHPEGFNIGINEGKVAGQTIMHLHIHIIPRYKNDVKNPVGGIRNIFPEKANYLKEIKNGRIQ